MPSADHDPGTPLQQMLVEQAKKQQKVEDTLRQYALERRHLQTYIERARANPMVQSIVTLRNYINNQLNIGAGSSK
ncbi:MAG: hypothetical protein QG599_2793 [Pseudomonadota bacterium]|nr:hypothetical protein [Pseudomonadota bacterium]